MILLLILVVMQFIPVDRNVPVVDPVTDFVSVEHPPQAVAQLLRDACYDCHSYETEYPWYSYVAPVSLWLQNHVTVGRKELNFSIWGTYSPKRKDHKMEEAIELVKEREMPLASFTWMHPEARLTDDQRAEITEYLQRAWVRMGGGENDEEEAER